MRMTTVLEALPEVGRPNGPVPMRERRARGQGKDVVRTRIDSTAGGRIEFYGRRFTNTGRHGPDCNWSLARCVSRNPKRRRCNYNRGCQIPKRGSRRKLKASRRSKPVTLIEGSTTGVSANCWWNSLANTSYYCRARNSCDRQLDRLSDDPALTASFGYISRKRLVGAEVPIAFDQEAKWAAKSRDFCK